MTGVNDLPAEVLAHMFVLAAADNLISSSSHLEPDGKKYLSLFSRESNVNCAPFVFLQVCGHWRTVTRSKYLLWTSLDASMWRKTVTRRSKSVEALQYWLSLSRCAPLSLLLETTDRRGDKLQTISEYGHTTAMLRVLANEGHRWRSISLRMDRRLTRVFVDMLLNPSSHASFPNLKRLDITCGGSAGYVEGLARAIGSIKSLTELCIAVHPDIVPSLLRYIPWRQLTTVYFHMLLTPSVAASILSQSTAIVNATFGFISTGLDRLYSDVQHCTVAKLKSLTVCAIDSMPVLHLFDAVDFPCLEQLEFRSNSFACDELLQWLSQQPDLPIQQLALKLSDYPPGSGLLAEWLRMHRIRQIPHVEFISGKILEIAAGAIAQLQDDVPVLWFWKPSHEEQRIGWKHYFDHADGQVTRIAPAPDSAP